MKDAATPTPPEETNRDVPGLSVVIPVYRAASTLRELHRRLSAVLSELGTPYEIIAVDDASPDDSWTVLCELAGQDRHVRAIQLMRNTGQAQTTLCGLNAARGDIVVTLDDDLEQPPEAIPRLVSVLLQREEVDGVLAVLTARRHARYRNWGSRLMQVVHARVFGLPRDLRTSSFRALRRSTVAALLQHDTSNPVISALIFSTTTRIANVPVEHAPRRAGRSGYSLGRQFSLAFDSLCSFTVLPLRIITAMGFLLFLFSVVLSVSLLARYFLGRIGVPGWTTVALLQTSFSGVILLALGVIGEYLVRITREVRGSPRHLERRRIGFEA